MTRIALVLAAAAVMFFAQPAQAAEDPYKFRPTHAVQIDDLDLTQAPDQDELRVRVEQAARRICTGEDTRRRRRACAAATVEYTMNLVSPDVRAAYAAASNRQRTFALAGN